MALSLNLYLNLPKQNSLTPIPNKLKRESIKQSKIYTEMHTVMILECKVDNVPNSNTVKRFVLDLIKCPLYLQGEVVEVTFVGANPKNSAENQVSIIVFQI